MRTPSKYIRADRDLTALSNPRAIPMRQIYKPRKARRAEGQNVRNLQVRVGMCVYIRRPFPATQLQGLTPRFTHHFDGPFVVQGHIHGLQDLLKLRHEITGQDIGAVTIEKIVIAPVTDPQELRPENETHSQPNPLHLPSRSLPMLLK